MLENLFTFLTESLYCGYGIALFASFICGILSMFLSPCHLSSIPLIVGFLTSQGEKKTSRAFLLSSLFAIGILVTIAILGAITAGLGRIMGDVGPYRKWFVAIIFFIIGLYLMDIIRLPDTRVGLLVPGIKSIFLSAFVLGLIFGIAL